MTPPELRSERLTLRALTRADIPALVPIYRNPEVTRFYARPVPDQAAVTELVERRLARFVQAGMGSWALWHDGVLVGLAHLMPSIELSGELPEMGWLLGRDHWGKGLATEAARAVLTHGLRRLHLSSVWALVHKDNSPSLAVASRLGLLDVGEGTHHGGPHRVLVGLADRVTPQPTTAIATNAISTVSSMSSGSSG